jgi:hypothetical protein
MRTFVVARAEAADPVHLEERLGVSRGDMLD